MFQFLKQIDKKTKPQIAGRNVWISSSKSPEERTKAKNLSKLKKVLLDTDLAKPEDVKVDYKRGIVFIDKLRAAEWKNTAEGDKLILNEEIMKRVGIDVEPSKLYDAVADLLRN